jgi:uncharacterized protein YydD (DUF2326 family)
MYLDKLYIYKNEKLVRDPIIFKKGLNLIMNSAKSSEGGNSVGKTTVLHLIKYCLGGDIKDIYKDSDKEKSEFNSIEDAFKKDKFIVKLDVKIDGKEVYIERELIIKNAFNKVNGELLDEKKFKSKISELCIKKNDIKLLPTWQQLKYKFIKPELKGTPIQFNIFEKAPDTYVMWLFLLGYNLDDILHKYAESKKKIGKNTVPRISALTSAVENIEKEIEKIDLKKKQFIFEKYSEDKQKEIKEKKKLLETIKKEVMNLAARINNINIHIETLKKDNRSNNPESLKKEIKYMYNQAKIYGIDEILQDYDNVVNFHFEMIVKKINTLDGMLIKHKKELDKKQNELNKISQYEKDILDYLENERLLPLYDNLSKDLNDKYELLGQAKEKLEVEQQRSKDILKYEKANTQILDYKEKIEYKLKNFSDIFNKYCKDILGNRENSILTFTNDKNLLPIIHRVDGKSKSGGEFKKNIVLLDLAYLAFSIQNKDINVPHFIMIDSIEQIDEVDLNKIFQIADNIKEGQVIFTCLKDKLYNVDEGLLNEARILELSIDDKLFRI